MESNRSPDYGLPERREHYEYASVVYRLDQAENQRQLDEIHDLGEGRGYRPSHLLEDWESPELDAVVRDIAAERVGPDRRTRAAALLTTLKRAWSGPRGLEGRAQVTAVYGYYSWRDVGKVTATWLSRISTVPWLSNRNREKRAPRELCIETPSNRAIHGEDPRIWAAEVSGTEAREPALLALGLEGEPSAGTLLDRLSDWVQLQVDGADVAWGDVHGIYAFLSTLCPAYPDAHRLVGDVPLAELRARFSSDRLIWASRGFVAPEEVRLGRPIFGDDIPTVPDHHELNGLWRTLGIQEPSAEDCIRWLRSFAHGDSTGARARSLEGRRLLVEVMRQLAKTIEKLPPDKKRQLRSLPLLVATGWNRKRPLYATAEPSRRDALIKHGLSVWDPPCALDNLKSLWAPCAVRILTDDDFAVSGVDHSWRVGMCSNRNSILPSRFSSPSSQRRMKTSIGLSHRGVRSNRRSSLLRPPRTVCDPWTSLSACAMRCLSPQGTTHALLSYLGGHCGMPPDSVPTGVLVSPR